ncbi:hypothetical protein [Shewanella subflava]|uniref:LPXTG cell wall anchor domain-containing protein n=1 Tax=Shewanella subflava TaxID=2986476 RepID=A0ABT3ICF8_9GAMM|nr:hypothetical protein [Shewanella subflava]MCW3173749.1 hypothetical protein [Shewanella subflava]
MGSSSRSASTQATENNSTTFGIQGANNGLILNGSGNTVTDGGAFNLVGKLVELLPDFNQAGLDMVSDGFNAVSDVSMVAERQNEHLLNTAGDLFGDVSNSQNEMMRLGASVLTETGDILQNSQNNAFDFGSDAMEHVSQTADAAIYANGMVTTEAMRGNSDLAAIVAGAIEAANDNNTFLAGRSMDNSAVLAETLTKTTLDAGNEANETAMGQLQRGFDSMMGFAEQYSRSDGAALAENNNKTMMYTLGGAALFAGAIVLAGRK